MVYRVVSTKLTEEEHAKFLDFCNKKGISPFAFLKDSITNSIESESEDKGSKWDMEKLKKELGI